MATVFLLLAVAEIGSAIYLSLRNETLPYSEEAFDLFVESAQWDVVTGDEQAAMIIPHPYLGYICNYDVIRPHKGKPNNRFGFFSEVEAIYQPGDSNEFVVVVLGGSVAAQLCIVGEEYLKSGLQDVPAIQGRTVVINSLAQGGYKQPQQLLNFAYHRSLGMHADLVLNLDGVNEMLFFFQNVRDYHIDPSFPYNWLSMAWGAERDTGVLRAQLTIADTRAKRANLADRMLKDRRYRSALVRTIHRRLDRALQVVERRAEHEVHESLIDVSARGLAFPQTGPVYWQGDDPEEIHAASACLWRRAGIALSDLVQAQGIPYLHMLQPNQYFPGTRTLTEWEQRYAYAPHTHVYEALHYGYAHFTNEIPRMRAANVPIVNINDYMEDPLETIYEDAFAHLNVLGNQLLAQAVVEQVRLVMDKHTTRNLD